MQAQRPDYFNQGRDHLAAEAYREAIDAFTKAYRLSLGDLAEILLYRGIAYAYLEQWSAAMKDFNGALQRNPYYAEPYNERGALRRLLGDAAGAIEDHTAAISLDPNHAEAYFNRALAYEQLGDYAAAEADLSHTLQRDPSIATVYEARGRVRAELKQYAGAIADYERYLRMGGGRAYDNHSETQSLIINLRLRLWWRRLLRRTSPNTEGSDQAHDTPEWT